MPPDADPFGDFELITLMFLNVFKVQNHVPVAAIVDEPILNLVVPNLCAVGVCEVEGGGDAAVVPGNIIPLPEPVEVGEVEGGGDAAFVPGNITPLPEPDEECEVEGGGDAAGGTAVAVAIWEPPDIGSDIPAVPEIDLRETEAQRSLRMTAEQLAWKLYDDAPPPPQFTENILRAARLEKARVAAAAIKLNAEWI